MNETIAITAETVTNIEPVSYEKGQHYHVPLNMLNTDPNQPRKSFDTEEMAALITSVKKYGVLQSILFRQDNDKNLLIVAGERRFKAATEAGLETIPAIFTTGNHSEIALVENMLRADMTPLEQAEGLKRLQDEANYMNKDLCAIIGKAESTVSEILSLNRLSAVIKEKVRGNSKISRAQLIKIVGKDEETMIKDFEALEKRLAPATKPTKTPVELLKAKITSVVDCLESFDFEEFEDPAREIINTELDMLAELISRKIATA